MTDSRKLKQILFLICIAVFTAISAYGMRRQMSFCMDIPIISEKEALEYTENQDKDDIQLLFKEKPAAVDVKTDTVYIPQKIKKNTLYTEFEGGLAADSENISLYFVKDEKMKDVYNSVEEGHCFTLLAVDKAKGESKSYSVVFTSLPVVNISGEVTGKNDEDRDVYSGDISLWNPEFRQTGKYNVKHSDALWHYRGNSNYYVDKKSVKLSLKNENMENNDLDLTGDDYQDDDWILNALYMDDTHLREKLIMDMWNSHSKADSFNCKMSSGEYVELVMNGRYYGIYLLENRVDAKYLKLEENQVLVKGQQGGDSTDIEDHYRIIYSNYDEELVWNTLTGIFNRDNGEYIVLENWIDISLFIQLGYMTDNSNRYNAFYLIDNIEDTPQITMILWDTDLALGIGWIDGVFTRSLEVASTKQRYRKEDESLRMIYPDLDEMIAERYKYMRENVFDEEEIFMHIEKLDSRLKNSGAFARNGERWGYRCNGEDTKDYLCSYINARFDYLDDIYGLK